MRLSSYLIGIAIYYFSVVNGKRETAASGFVFRREVGLCVQGLFFKWQFLYCQNRGFHGFRGLLLCNIKAFAKRTVFCFIAMSAAELAAQRCLLAFEHYMFVQNS